MGSFPETYIDLNCQFVNTSKNVSKKCQCYKLNVEHYPKEPFFLYQNHYGNRPLSSLI